MYFRVHQYSISAKGHPDEVGISHRDVRLPVALDFHTKIGDATHASAPFLLRFLMRLPGFESQASAQNHTGLATNHEIVMTSPFPPPT